MKLEPIRSTRFSPPRRTHVPRAPDVDNGGNKQVLRGPLRLAAALLAGALMISGTAAACEHYTAYPDVVLDSFYASAPTQPRIFMDQERGRLAMRKCSFPGGPSPVIVRLDIPGFTYVGELQYEGRTYASYATSADSALLAFDVYWNALDRRPLRLGEEMEMMYETRAGDGLQYTVSYTALVFSRGGQMRSSSVRTGVVSLRSPMYPGLDSSAYYYLAPAFSPDLQGIRTGGSGEGESTSAGENS